MAEHRRCEHCQHQHAADQFRSDKCIDCRTEGVEAHKRRIEAALNRRYLIQANMAWRAQAANR